MNIPKLGETTTDMELLGRRDALHVPCVLVRSEGSLTAGESVRFIDADCTCVRVCSSEHRHGVVDPFAGDYIPEGTLVHIFLTPAIVRNFAHHYEIVKEVVDVGLYEELVNDGNWCKQSNCS